jgi:hypothetical protein
MLTLALAALMLAAGAPVAPGRPAYAEGQVWEYKTRAHEAGSRVRIHRMRDAREVGLTGTIYHVGIVGVRFEGPYATSGTIGHLPVSRATLDASVTRLADDQAIPFPPFEEGIAEWQRAQGGVFTISLAEVVDVAERALRDSAAEPVS